MTRVWEYVANTHNYLIVASYQIIVTFENIRFNALVITTINYQNKVVVILGPTRSRNMGYASRAIFPSTTNLLHLDSNISICT